jgi:uncharacterized membrane protein YcfT
MTPRRVLLAGLKQMTVSGNSSRLAWVDYAKGICIILVILMHANGGVEKLTGHATFIDSFIQWAKPFRMPDFFLISGLFLANRINQSWPKFLDAKVLHFGYFYILWAIIQHGVKDLTLGEAPDAGLSHYLTFLAQPTPTLWFIYLLAIFFVVAKITMPLPKLLVFVAAAVLEALPVDTGSIIIDEFCGRFVFFYAGYWIAPLVFAFASRIGTSRAGFVLASLTAWAVGNAVMVESGFAKLPGFSLALGLAGTGALIAVSVLSARSGRLGALRYCGEHSIVIYLAFTLFMGPARLALFTVAPGIAPVLVSLVSTLAGVAGPLLIHAAVKGTWLGFLFRRPDWARLQLWWQRAPKERMASVTSDVARLSH